jgi:hypothetical protein
MILGLDISTSIIGLTIIDNGSIIKTDAIDLRNKPNTTKSKAN